MPRPSGHPSTFNSTGSYFNSLGTIGSGFGRPAGGVQASGPDWPATISRLGRVKDSTHGLNSSPLLAAAILSGGFAGPLAAQAPGESAFARALVRSFAAATAASAGGGIGLRFTKPHSRFLFDFSVAADATATGEHGRRRRLAPEFAPSSTPRGQSEQLALHRSAGRDGHAALRPADGSKSESAITGFSRTTARAAWRWYGYGTVVNGTMLQPVHPVIPAIVANPSLNSPEPPPPGPLHMPSIVPMPMPPGPGTPADSRLPAQCLPGHRHRRRSRRCRYRTRPMNRPGGRSMAVSERISPANRESWRRTSRRARRTTQGSPGQYSFRHTRRTHRRHPNQFRRRQPKARSSHCGQRSKRSAPAAAGTSKCSTAAPIAF